MSLSPAGRRGTVSSRPRGGLAGGAVRRAGGRPPAVRIGLLAFVAVAAAAVIAIVALLLSGGSDGCAEAYCEATAGEVAVPDGFESLSRVFERNANADPLPDGFELRITIPLDAPAPGVRGLRFFRHTGAGGAWEPASSAQLDDAGERASGVFADPPRYLAVMRRVGGGRQLAVTLERGATLHPVAARLATIAHTLDFTPAADGSLLGDAGERPAGLNAGAAHYPVVSASTAIDGTAANVDAILATDVARTNHVRRIVERVLADRLDGIGIAYLDLRADQRTSFTLFALELSEELHAEGKVLTLALSAPVVGAERIDEGAYDWAALGGAADYLAIAPVRDQSAFRLHMPEILDHLVAAMDPERLLLTLTPYASEKSADGLRTLTLTEAMTIASQLGVRSESVTAGASIQIVAVNIDRDEGLSGLRWQPETATVAFTYKLGGGRTVWIENAFSAAFKLEFASAWSLGGLAVEDASDNAFLGDIWGAIEPFLESGQPVLRQPAPTDLLPDWRVTGGSLIGGDRGIVTWQAPPEAGAYRVTLGISDGVERFENHITLVLPPPERETTSQAP